MSWPDPCGCLSGDEVTGWHEVRSPECLEHEHEIWRQMIRHINERTTAVSDPSIRHDYEPGDVTGPMQTDPDCRICGEPKRSAVHR
jgi:hypothetical protein